MRYWILFFLLSVFVACQNDGADTEEGDLKQQFFENGELATEVRFKDGKRHGLSRSYYESGSLRSEVIYDQGMKHGICKNYYKDGNLSTEMNYVNDEKNGLTRKYYSSGVVYYEANYKDGKKHGSRKVFSRSGNLKSEMMYDDGKPLPGAKRYKPGGKLRSEPKVKFQLENESFSRGIVTVRMSLDEEMPDVKYHRGRLDGQGNLVDDQGACWSEGPHNEAVIKYSRPYGGLLMDRIDIVATATDRDQQVYVLTGTYNLVVD